MENFELKIAMRLVKEDGTFGKKETPSTDWENVWFVDYGGFQFVVDQNENIIKLGIAQLDTDSMMEDWVPMDCIDPGIEVYTRFLKRLVEIIGYVQDQQYAAGMTAEKHDPAYVTMVALSLELSLTVRQSNMIWHIIDK